MQVTADRGRIVSARTMPRTVLLPWEGMTVDKPIARVLNLIDDREQRLWTLTPDQARGRLLDGPEAVLGIDGSFALAARRGVDVVMARSLDRPMRYFLAKESSGPMLVIAQRIDEIRDCLAAEGYLDQFHPTYTRMVPAHHATTLRLVGCPDPNPTHERFFDPPRGTLPPDLDLIGERYVEALMFELRGWLAALPAGAAREPIGVCFSGGIDSGAVLLALNRALLESGRSAARLKAFTLRVGAGAGDAEQAREFLRRVDLEMLGEEVEAGAADVDPLAAIEVIEDYKPLDVECAAVGLALLRGIRARYPDWRLLVDGDGGDENLKDYPLEENHELTITSVVNNSMLYQEGWGVDAVKHSQTYSGGLGRATVRTHAPARLLGFEGFSPFTRPGGHRGGRGDSIRHPGRRLPRGALRPEGRGHTPRHEAGSRRRLPGLPEAPLPGGRGLGGRVRGRLRPAPGAVPPALPVALRLTSMPATDAPAAAVRALRPPRPTHDPWLPQGVTVELERGPGGESTPSATVFLTGAECPFTCVFCDLWRYTIDGPTPAGALPAQLRAALERLPGLLREAGLDRCDQLKLYNASNFFDRRAVPEEDLEPIARLAGGFRRVVVECHPRLVDDRVRRFAELLRGRLEVAMGLETAHPEALSRLGKQLTLEQFDRAAERLRADGVDLRVFVLVGVPFVPSAEQAKWVAESVRHAARAVPGRWP